MKLGCSSWSFHRLFEEGKINQKRWIEKCADEFLLDGIELLDFHFPSVNDADIKEIKKLIVNKGLAVSCISVSNNFGAPTEKARQKEVKKVKKWIEIAQKYGAPTLRIFAGWPGLAPWESNSSEPAKVDRGKLWPEMINCIKECAKCAEDIGIILAVENHNHKGFVKTADEVLRIMKEVNSDWVKLNLDTGGYQDGYSAIEKTADISVHIHAKFYDVDEEGSDQILDYNRIFSILNEKKYKGFISIEYEGKEEEKLAIPRIVKFLRRFVK